MPRLAAMSSSLIPAIPFEDQRLEDRRVEAAVGLGFAGEAAVELGGVA